MMSRVAVPLFSLLVWILILAWSDGIIPTDPVEARETSVVSSGGFYCTATVAQGPLAGCQEGEGVRWDTAQLLVSTTFKCTGADAPKVATTASHQLGSCAIYSLPIARGKTNEPTYRRPCRSPRTGRPRPCQVCDRPH